MIEYLLTVLPTLRENLAELVVLVVTFLSRDIIIWFKNKKHREDFKKTLAKIVVDLANVVEDLSKVKAELQTNGGHTTKDLALKTHKAVEVNSRQITELSDQLKEIRIQQRARLEQQLNESMDCQMLFDEKGNCTFANEAVQALFGKGFEFFEGQRWFSFIKNQQDRQRVKQSWDFSITNQVAFTEEFSIRGSLSLQKLYMSTVTKYDDNGKPIWIIAKIKPI